MEVSVAYQGGGAKVVELMAAAKACIEIAASRRDFKVFRVSGTSAGAIAAAMHATGCDIDAIAASSEKLRKLVEKHFNPRRMKGWRIARRLWFGNSIFDENDLREVIRGLFSLGKIDAAQPIQDLVRDGLQLRILRSDIHSHDSLTAEETSDVLLLDALVDSCAIPFAFRVPGPGTNAHLLDGGLFHNLPAREALKDLKPGQEVLGLSFESTPVKRVENASLGAYAAAIIESMLNERLRDATLQIKDANVIALPNKRGTFEFADIFAGDFYKTFQEEVEGSVVAITGWIKDSKVFDEPDWFSNHPKDVAEQARRTSQEIVRFYDEVGERPYSAELIYHEVTFQSSINPKSPDIYNLHMVLEGDANPGLQFMRFWFYNSAVGPLKRSTIDVRDAKGKRRNVMLLPIRHEGPERLRANLICLDRPLERGERITILKSERSFQGMAEYVRDGISYETLVLGPRKFAKELRITVHFPEDEKPAFVRDASGDFPDEQRKLEEEDGTQLFTKAKKSPTRRTGWVSRVNSAKPKAPCDEPLFIKIVYDKGRGAR